MPHFPRFSDPNKPLFLVFWLDWWVLAFLYHHIFLYWICLEQINMRKGGNMFGVQEAPFPAIPFQMKDLFSSGNSTAKAKGVKPHAWGLPKARLILWNKNGRNGALLSYSVLQAFLHGLLSRKRDMFLELSCQGPSPSFKIQVVLEFDIIV